MLGAVPQRATGCHRCLHVAVDFDLSNILITVGSCIARAQSRQRVRRVEVTAEMIGDFGPPVGNRFIWRSAVGGKPVNLRRNKIDGAVGEPCQGVGENFVVLPVAGRYRTFFKTVFIGGGSGNTGRTDAESQVGTFFLNHVLNLAHERIDILATPVAERQTRTRRFIQIVIGGCARGWDVVRIEIVVEENTVNLIVVDNLGYDIKNMPACGRQAGIEHGVFIVCKQYPVSSPLFVLRSGVCGS